MRQRTKNHTKQNNVKQSNTNIVKHNGVVFCKFLLKYTGISFVKQALMRVINLVCKKQKKKEDCNKKIVNIELSENIIGELGMDVNQHQNQCNHSELEIIRHIEEFFNLRVSEVMVPCAEVIAVGHDISASQLKNKFIETSFTRIPIYKDTLDSMIGFIHVKDFMRCMGEADINDKFNIVEMMRLVIYVPRSTRCMDLLVKMREEKTHMAVVLDEYGGTEGILTIEHLIEEIVGQIEGEHSKSKTDPVFIKKINDDTYIVDAKASVQDTGDMIGIGSLLEEEKGEYETVGGFILSYLDRIPMRGETFLHPSGAMFYILEADERKIQSVRIVMNKTAE